jgi:hypothetical protein
MEVYVLGTEYTIEYILYFDLVCESMGVGAAQSV